MVPRSSILTHIHIFHHFSLRTHHPGQWDRHAACLFHLHLVQSLQNRRRWRSSHIPARVATVATVALPDSWVSQNKAGNLGMGFCIDGNQAMSPTSAKKSTCDGFQMWIDGWIKELVSFSRIISQKGGGLRFHPGTRHLVVP